MITYHILISEEQRIELLKIITSSGADAEDQPLEYWKDMLTALPTEEAFEPGLVYGFCL